MDSQDTIPTSRYRPASSAEAVHLLAGVASWESRSVPTIACGTPVPTDKPERWTRRPQAVTCDECRLSDAFRAARAKKRPQGKRLGERGLITPSVAEACTWLGVEPSDG